ncbi:hypothetical protein AHAS_Ahas17G0298700 [Arachis hypogaea]
MVANRQGRPRWEETSEETFLDATAILESVKAMAAAVRDSVAATNRVAKRLDRHTRAESSHGTRRGNRNSDEGEDRLRNDNWAAMLASFLKINSATVQWKQKCYVS